MTEKKTHILCILDGWGHRDEHHGNAVELGGTPNFHRIKETWPHAVTVTSGLDVGLPDGQMGNSEVGHMNIGAGRVVMQELPKIDQALKDGSLAQNERIQNAIKTMLETKGTMHLMGLLSDGGVHSHINHMIGVTKIFSEAGVPVCLHPFFDGRDTPPDSGLKYMQQFIEATKDLKNVSIGTLSGRYYGMDRDKRWERVEKAYNAMVLKEGPVVRNPIEAISKSYTEKVYDEFIVPCVLESYAGMNDGDGLMMVNFRLDRSREITNILMDPDFKDAERKRVVNFAVKLGMTEYSKDHNAFMQVVYPPESLTGILGEIISKKGMTQLRLAETEKYAHVTFYMNGGEERVYEGEERILVPSPKVATYDLQPEMSAFEVCDNLVKSIESKKFDLIIVNFANGDMVGHTGIMEAAEKAVSAVDQCLAKVEKAVMETGAVWIITADHGNCELMIDPCSGGPFTAHTTFPVDTILVNTPDVKGLKEGRLADLSPTLLDLMGIEKPAEMTGKSLLIR